MSGLWLITRVATTAALTACGVIPANAAPLTFETLANVQAGNEEKDGISWFETWDHGMRFVLEAKHRDKSEALWSVLTSSYRHGLAVRVRYDASAARFDPTVRRIVYPICSVELDDHIVESGRSCRSIAGTAGRKSGGAEQLISLALAQLASGAPRAAVDLLDKSLARPALNPDLLKLAIRARADSYEALSYEEQPATDAADRATVAALADDRKYATLAPDDIDVQFSIGQALEQLGDYELARLTYEQIQKRWPDEDFRVTLRLAALARQAGDAEDSLNILNGLVERLGAQNSMRYHYHRGWTLNKLGRFDEAIAEFNQGLKAQPDYAYAYLHRACAYASVGDLSSALSDMETAARHLGKVLRTEGSRSIEHDLGTIAKGASSLRAASKAGSKAAMPTICDGYWGADYKPRSRSRLLPPS